MFQTRVVKASLAGMAAMLLLAPFTDFAEQPRAADVPAQNASQPVTTTQPVQRTQVMDAPLTVTYQYDSLGRLINESYPANTVAHSYDPAGNRTQSSTQ